MHTKSIATLIPALCTLALPAIAQPTAPQAAPNRSSAPEVSLSMSHVWFDGADLDSGGELESNHSYLRAGIDWQRGRGESIGLSIGAAAHSYSFDNIGGTEPWDDVASYSLGLNWRRPHGDAGMWFVAPSVDFSGASGADFGDSLTYGTVASYAHRFSDSLTLGFGIAAFHGLEDSNVFPVILIDWQINDRWSVGNPFRPGPVGPAGIELVYAVSADFEIGLGGGWRSNRFRLDDDGTVPDGIGEVQGVPAFLRLSWKLNDAFSADLFAGMFLAGEVTLEDENGHELDSNDLDSTPLAGLSFTGRF